MAAVKANDFLDASDSEDDQLNGYDSEDEVTKGGRGPKRRKISSDDEDDDNDDGASDQDQDDDEEDKDGSEQTKNGEENNGGEEKTKAKKLKSKDLPRVAQPATKKNLITTDEAIKKSGVVYISRVPPFMKPNKLRSLLTPYGTINRIFLAPEDPVARARRIKGGGNKKKTFTEGWVEFVKKKDAKAACELLNARPIGGKKGSYYHDDIWNLLYLNGFKWHNLTEQIAAEDAERTSRMRAEISKTTRENKLFVRNVERAKMLDGMEAKAKAKKRKANDAAVAGEEPKQSIRTFRQIAKISKGDDTNEQPERVNRPSISHKTGIRFGRLLRLHLRSVRATCYDCIKLTNDITNGIQREATIQQCRDCERWMLPPASWIVAMPESRELLALCLKKLRGLNKVRIVDASFIWTEPHSRRVKVKLTIQDSVQQGVLLQQSFEVVYVVAFQQCPDCQKSFTPNHWRACVQVRQKVLHKRTFHFLEQLILKHGAHKETLNIKEAKDGIDFFFSVRNQAEKFVDFLNSVVPVKVKAAQELISMDTHTSKKSYKFTFSAEIVPVCRDDLVALPIKMAKQSGNISPLVLCHKIGTAVYLMDPQTLQTAEVSASLYWRAPFTALADAMELVEFIIMDIEPTPTRNGRWLLAEATVARASDLGVNDRTYFTRTHLGGLLQPGDSAMGYLLNGTNFNNPEYDAIEESNTYSSIIPDVVLVKKHYPNRRRNRRRNWKLKRMAKDEGELLPKKADQERMDKEYEMFLRDVEEDEELRAALAVYKNPRKVTDEEMSVAETDMDGDDGVPTVNMDELLDDFDELTMED
ncbi:NMD3-domain-containing protein [Trichoderma asperelloides]|nr:NMD3-domain-containing protein [Trichoderma asperelloides]